MITFRTVLTIIFVFTWQLGSSQTCEEYNRKLFHSLPDDFPEKINCKDITGKKQGWWIEYKVEYNPVEKPDELAKGDFVQDYSYGQYQDNRKTGTWTTINNVHIITPLRQDKYYHMPDTSRVTSWTSGKETLGADILYTRDSTVIRATSFAAGEKYPLCIDCDKRKSLECVLTYRSKVIKKFPFEDFEWEFKQTFFPFMYVREKKKIDEKLK